jgi:hypothetical protein
MVTLFTSYYLAQKYEFEKHWERLKEEEENSI